MICIFKPASHSLRRVMLLYIYIYIYIKYSFYIPPSFYTWQCFHCQTAYVMCSHEPINKVFSAWCHVTHPVRWLGDQLCLSFSCSKCCKITQDYISYFKKIWSDKQTGIYNFNIWWGLDLDARTSESKVLNKFWYGVYTAATILQKMVKIHAFSSKYFFQNMIHICFNYYDLIPSTRQAIS